MEATTKAHLLVPCVLFYSCRVFGIFMVAFTSMRYPTCSCTGFQSSIYRVSLFSGGVNMDIEMEGGHCHCGGQDKLFSIQFRGNSTSDVCWYDLLRYLGWYICDVHTKEQMVQVVHERVVLQCTFDWNAVQSATVVLCPAEIRRLFRDELDTTADWSLCGLTPLSSGITVGYGRVDGDFVPLPSCWP